MKLRFLRSALRNVREISAYIHDHNPQAAVRVGNRIRKVAAMLSEHPSMGAPGRVGGTREFKIPDLPFRIVYRVSEKAGDPPVLEVLRIFHIRRQPPPPDWDEE